MFCFSHFTRMSAYDERALQDIWHQRGANFYTGAIDPPPWDPAGPNDYLRAHKLKGIEDCIEWLKQ